MKNRMNVKRSILIIACFLLLVVISCKHHLAEEKFWGPEYAAASDGFYVVDNKVTASPASVDFQASADTFKASMSDPVSWTLTITGQTSGAVKTITGLSKDINVTWDGTSSNNMFFRTNETCNAVLTFLGTNISVSANVTILKSRKYDGVLVTDFDGSGRTKDTTYGGPHPWYIYTDNATVGGISVAEFSHTYQNAVPAIQGDVCLRLFGKDINNNWFSGGVGFWPASLKNQLQTLSSSPEGVYLNLFVNGNGNKSTILSISIFEFAASSTDPRDIFTKNVTIDWDGWKLVSIRLSDFTVSPNSTANKIMDLEKLSTMEFVPSPAQLGAAVEANIDYIIYTGNTPFQP